MTNAELSKLVLQNQGKIDVISEKISHLDERMDKQEKLTSAVHEMAINVQKLTDNMSTLADTQKMFMESQKAQGERIGAIEKEPGTRAKTLVWTIITGVVMSILGVIGGLITSNLLKP
jgi:predicted  nucleic acid-binding Zn-ribbon protein